MTVFRLARMIPRLLLQRRCSATQIASPRIATLPCTGRDTSFCISACLMSDIRVEYYPPPCSVQKDIRCSLVACAGTSIWLMLVPMHTFIHMLIHIFRLLLDLLTTSRLSDHQKDLEIVLLRQQLRIMQRKFPRSPRISQWEKGLLAVLTVRLKSLPTTTRTRLEEIMLLFKPDTVLRWHRDLVKRKWTFRQDRPIGRPAVAAELEALIVRLATENPRWGYSKIQGELIKLGHTISRCSVRNVLKHRHIPPSPQRKQQGTNWRTFLGHYAEDVGL